MKVPFNLFNKRLIDKELAIALQKQEIAKAQYFKVEDDELIAIQVSIASRIIKRLRKVDLNFTRENDCASINKYGFKDAGNVVISLPYSKYLFEVIEELYRDPSCVFYMIGEGEIDLPLFQSLCALPRVQLVDHRSALKIGSATTQQTNIFFSIPELHPKTLDSDLRLDVIDLPCLFSSYGILLANKHNASFFSVDISNGSPKLRKISSMSQRKGEFKFDTPAYLNDLAIAFSAKPSNVYSWSRLTSHLADSIEKRFISTANHLEGLIRMANSHKSSPLAQEMIGLIHDKKTNVLNKRG